MNLVIIQHVSLWLSLLFAFFDVVLLFLCMTGALAPTPDPSGPQLAVIGGPLRAPDLRAAA